MYVLDFLDIVLYKYFGKKKSSDDILNFLLILYLSKPLRGCQNVVEVLLNTGGL